MFQDEYLDLLDGDDVEAVSAAAYGGVEYLDAGRVDEQLAFDAPAESLTYHGHCNQKATNKDHHAVGVLRRAGYDVDPLDSSCCGMAGSFGYESEHYDISKAIGRILFDQVERERRRDGDRAGRLLPLAAGGDRDGAENPPHPIEKVAEAVTGAASDAVADAGARRGREPVARRRLRQRRGARDALTDRV